MSKHSLSQAAVDLQNAVISFGRSAKSFSSAFKAFSILIEEQKRKEKQRKILMIKFYTLGLTWNEKKRLETI